MEPDVDAFWNRLQSLIKHSSYTQKSLSETLGLNAHSLEVMKAKKNVPGTFLTYKIAKLLNTSVEYLVSGEEPKLDPALSELSELKQRINELANSIK